MGDHPRHLLRPPDPAQRVQQRHLLLDPRGRGRVEPGEQGVVAGGADRAERDGVHADAVATVVDGQRAGQALDRGLRRGVGQRPGHRALRLVRRHVHDRAAAAGRPQVPHRGGGADHGEREVGHDRLEHRGGRGVGQGEVAEHRGVVHPAAQRRRGLRPPRRVLGDGLVGGVARHGPHAGSGVRCRVTVDDHHEGRVGGRREPVDDRPADPARATGHHVRVRHVDDRARPHRRARCAPGHATIRREPPRRRNDGRLPGNACGLLVRAALPTVDVPGPHTRPHPSTLPRSAP